jgi:hypothetical protein
MDMSVALHSTFTDNSRKLFTNQADCNDAFAEHVRFGLDERDQSRANTL